MSSYIQENTGSSEEPILSNSGINQTDVEDPNSRDSPVTSGIAFYDRNKLIELFFCLFPIPFALFVEYAAFADTIKPYQRSIPYQIIDDIGEYIRELLYDLPDTGETVPTYMLGLAMGIPFLFQIGICFLSYRKGFGRTNMLHNTICVWSLGLCLTSLLTNFGKLYVGFFRPIFYAVCEPDDNYQECTSGDDNAARVSFPSGHASQSVFALLSFSLFLEYSFGMTAYKRLSRSNPQEPIKNTRVLSVLCYVPVLLAYFIRKYTYALHDANCPAMC